MDAPRASACPTSAAAFTAVRCCRRRPGFLRPARIFSMRKGFPVTSASESEVRRIWPPPSPADPSTVSMSAIQRVVLTGEPLARGEWLFSPSPLEHQAQGMHGEELHERRVGGYEGRASGHQFSPEQAMEPRKVVPGNARVKMVLQMKILVAHEECDHGASEDRARAADGVLWLIEERVLAHASDVDQRVDEDHGQGPGMHEPCSRNGRKEYCRDQEDEKPRLEEGPETIGFFTVAQGEKRDRGDVGRVASEEPPPMHEEQEPGPPAVVLVMVWIPMPPRVVVMAQVEHTVGGKVLKHRKG